jgi:glycerophosphoryl diester phosphodiesterase
MSSKYRGKGIHLVMTWPAAVAIVAVLVACPCLGVEIIAHRGASQLAPENTLASANLAWKLKTDAVEIDIYLTKDGRIVAMHDKDTERTTGRKWKVAEHTLAELRRLDAGSWKDPSYAGEKIPTLEEILASIPDGRRLFIEIKCGKEVLPELRRRVLASRKSASQIVVIAFDLETATEWKQMMPEVKTYWLFGHSPTRDKKTKKITGGRIEELIEKCRVAKLDGLDLAHGSELNKEIVDKIHGLGLEFYVWTVNEPEEAVRVLNWGVDGITTDRPKWLREKLQAQGVLPAR